jgi:hypothetical protein
MPKHAIRTRAGAALTCAVCVALLATGCDDDAAQDGGGADDGASAKAHPAVSASKAADSDGGKTLALGEATLITYKRGSDHVRGTLKVTAVSVRKGKRADLGTLKLDAGARALQPYYVTMSFKNVGDRSLHYPFLNTPTGLEDSSGVDDQTLITADDEVKPCPGKDPDDFAKGASTSLCKVFLLPKTEKPTVVTYSTGDNTKKPVHWKAARSREAR